MTHARILSLDYAGYLRAVTKFPNIKASIDDSMAKLFSMMKEKKRPWEIFYFKNHSNEGDKKEPFLSETLINVYRYHKTIATNYWEPFQPWGKLRFLQFLLLPLVLPPQSK